MRTDVDRGSGLLAMGERATFTIDVSGRLADDSAEGLLAALEAVRWVERLPELQVVEDSVRYGALVRSSARSKGTDRRFRQHSKFENFVRSASGQVPVLGLDAEQAGPEALVPLDQPSRDARQVRGRP